MSNSRKGNMPFVAPVRPSNLLWVPIVGLAYAVTQLWGTPHMRIRYTWNGHFAVPVYRSCEYWGSSSTFRIIPADGKCPLFVLARPKRER